MYNSYSKISKIMRKQNFYFTCDVDVYFDVALNKRNAGKGCVFCEGLFSCYDSMSMAVRKSFLRQNVTIDSNRTSSVFVDVNVSA